MVGSVQEFRFRKFYRKREPRVILGKVTKSFVEVGAGNSVIVL